MASKRKKKRNKSKVTTNQAVSDDSMSEFQTNEFAVLRQMFHDRSSILNQQILGQSFCGNRDLYKAVGYPNVPSFSQYNGRFMRQDIANRVVRAYPESTWERAPKVKENDTPDNTTPFEKRWAEIEDENKVWHYLNRGDILSGIGQYGVLILGFNDGRTLSEPVERATKLSYIQPYSRGKIDIVDWHDDPIDDNYGSPKYYNIDLGSGTTTKTQQVHPSRVIHLCENKYESDWIGSSRIEMVYNRLQDLETIIAGSAEMFWKGAFSGYNVKVDPSKPVSAEVLNDMKDQLRDFFNDLERYVATQGTSIEGIDQIISDPSNQVQVQIMMISAATGIPQRILLGSEQAQLASSQDKRNWNDKVMARQQNYAEPFVLRAFIDRLIMVGVLPTPINGYEIEWPDLNTVSDEDKSRNAKVLTEALAIYSEKSVENVMPRDFFFANILGLTADQIASINKDVEGGESGLGEGLEDEVEGELEDDDLDDADE